MEWKTKYGIGDKVFVAQRKVDIKPCVECNGTGKVPYKSKKIDCPECGAGREIHTVYHIPIEVVISYVAIQALSDKQETKYGFVDSWDNLLEGKVFSTKKECLKTINIDEGE